MFLDARRELAGEVVWDGKRQVVLGDPPAAIFFDQHPGDPVQTAVDRFDRGVQEQVLGEGVMSSVVTRISLYEVEVVAQGRTRGWRSTVIARVDLENGPRVMRWHRFQSPE